MSLRTWVSDQLHEVLGFSDGNVADYVLAVAKTSKSADVLKERICAVAEVPDGARANRFYAELHSRTNSGVMAASTAAPAVRVTSTNRNVDMLQKSKDYGFVVAPSLDIDAHAAPQQSLTYGGSVLSSATSSLHSRSTTTTKRHPGETKEQQLLREQRLVGFGE